jgi:hypothetical protein
VFLNGRVEFAPASRRIPISRPESDVASKTNKSDRAKGNATADMPYSKIPTSRPVGDVASKTSKSDTTKGNATADVPAQCRGGGSKKLGTRPAAGDLLTDALLRPHSEQHFATTSNYEELWLKAVWGNLEQREKLLPAGMPTVQKKYGFDKHNCAVVSTRLRCQFGSAQL